MAKNFNNQALTVSQKIFERLLLAYPKAHRAKYGPAMAQLFRDQCRGAWNESRSWGVMKLWLRILPDLVNTSIAERLSALKERKSMSDKLASLFRFRQATPLSTFVANFVVMFLLVLMTSVTITFILPESYASTTRIKVETDEPVTSAVPYDPYFLQTTFEIIQSQVVLNPVMDKLNLNAVWGKKHFNGEILKPANTMELLKQRMQLNTVRNTKLISITVYSDDKNEAPQIANAIAESYRDYRSQSQSEVKAKGIDALQNQYQEQEGQIRQAETELGSLRQKLNIPEDDSLSPTEFQQHYDKKLTDGEQAYREQLVQLNELQKLGKGQLRDILPSVSPDTMLAGLLDKLHEGEQQYASLTNDYLLSNIKIMRIQSVIDTLNNQIDDRIAGIMAGLEAQVKAKRVALDSMAAQVEVVKAAQPYWDKKRDLEQLVGFHKLLATKIEAVKLNGKIPNALPVEIIDSAAPGLMPVRPNKSLNITLGAIAGIFLASIAGAISTFIAFPNRR
jgi:polysaccharide biosynthesis transport protein